MIRRLALVLLVVAAGVACRPYTNPPQPFNHADTYAAIEELFAALGPAAVAKAHCIVQRESGHNPYANITTRSIYKGAWQINSTNAGYQGSVQAAAATLGGGHSASLYDPWTATQTARIIMASRANQGLDPWSPWTTARFC